MFLENFMQAISRDILCYAMQTLSDRLICAYIHDEIILEVPLYTKVDDICALMGQTPPWIPGLLLRVNRYETGFYRKD